MRRFGRWSRSQMALLLALVACGSARIHEGIVSEEQGIQVAVTDEPVLLIFVLDDTHEAGSIYRRLGNGSAAVGPWLFDQNPSSRFGVISSYSDVPSRWMGGRTFPATDDEFESSDAVSDALWDLLNERQVYEPSPRSAIANAITSGLLDPPEDAPPTVFLIMTAFDDHSPPEDVDVVREYMETTQYGTAWELVRPRGGECRGPSSTERAGHDVTLDALEDVPFLGEFELCTDFGEAEWLEGATSTEHRVNSASVTLPDGVIEDTLTVWGVGGNGEVRIPDDQLVLDGTSLEILPPVAQFTELEVRYDVRVED